MRQNGLPDSCSVWVRVTVGGLIELVTLGQYVLIAGLYCHVNEVNGIYQCLIELKDWLLWPIVVALAALAYKIQIYTKSE